MAKISIDRNFSIVPNELLANAEISFRAKGIYAYIQGKPDNWDFSVEGIAHQSKEGKDAIRAALKELEEHGYLDRVKRKNQSGHFEIEYLLYSSPKVGKPDDGKPADGISDGGEPAQSYKKELSNKDLSKKEQEIEQFEKFRKEYPGQKRGLETELKTFQKHKDWKEVLPLLLPALQDQIKDHNSRKAKNQFAPEWPMLSTYLNQRRWEIKPALGVPLLRFDHNGKRI